MKDTIKVCLYGNGGGHQVWKAYTLPGVEVVGITGVEEEKYRESALKASKGWWEPCSSPHVKNTSEPQAEPLGQ